MWATSPAPTLRTAASPKVMAPGPEAVDPASSVPSEKSAANSDSDRLTSGTRTSMPRERHSARYTAVLSLLSFTEVSSDARYSTG